MACHKERGIIGSVACPTCGLSCNVTVCPKCDDGKLSGFCAEHGGFNCKLELV